MQVAITGAKGFIARNLRVRLTELGYDDIRQISHQLTSAELDSALTDVDMVFHLSGVNRPKDPAEFIEGNVGFTGLICDSLVRVAPKAAIVFSSSTQAAIDNEYGGSKKTAEDVLIKHGETTGAAVMISRLTNVFGKWSRPNYNSAVATFCHNIANDLPITVNNPDAPLKLVYIDDVIASLIGLLNENTRPSGFFDVTPEYDTTVGEVADIIRSFRESRTSLVTPPVGEGLVRALYSTYVSVFTPKQFAYDLPMHGDPRGTFSEMLKTPDCGQFSYFTAHPGITRGEHYHHSKTEKFLVLKGKANFGFRHIETNETHNIVTSGKKAQVVETVPGWTHDITNIGDDEMIVMLWANEVFDRDRPDTIAMKVNS
ncbi:UDP-2-acetamido-2,6-beta-L-arabino-hexul-4-ose reductase [Parasphingorhabdus halotolerans]|uniref:SDR family oxidoreductase n=1 Tax=Parasphingorhabdus halotolerans TaxID=2725558 RepID=A0A6H2DNN5_9SPHN|nr:NAD-dependent epimerase/dehydratase family protein [Parasphingorhabdus halotolerans]QJB69747.1 SDR family oxidoreductase [Parasphingorhabdus halotolerans]